LTIIKDYALLCIKIVIDNLVCWRDLKTRHTQDFSPTKICRSTDIMLL